MACLENELNRISAAQDANPDEGRTVQISCDQCGVCFIKATKENGRIYQSGVYGYTLENMPSLPEFCELKKI